MNGSSWTFPALAAQLAGWVIPLCTSAALAAGDPVRIGVIGLDSVRAEQFATRLNDPAQPTHVAGGRIVSAFRAAEGEAVEASATILNTKFGVSIVDSLDELLSKVDAVLLLSSVDSFLLDHAKQVMAAGKPLFIDPPAAPDLSQAIELFRSAQQLSVPILSASALRWSSGLLTLKPEGIGRPQAAVCWGPAPGLADSTYPRGIQAAEALFTLMGGGCLTVVNTSSTTQSVITGVWADGRIGTLHAIHTLPLESNACTLVRFDDTQVSEQTCQMDLSPLLREVIKFFASKQPPVSPRATLEIYGFLQAAVESQQRGGAKVSVREVLQQADALEEWLPELPPPPAPPQESQPPTAAPTPAQP